MSKASSTPSLHKFLFNVFNVAKLSASEKRKGAKSQQRHRRRFGNYRTGNIINVVRVCSILAIGIQSRFFLGYKIYSANAAELILCQYVSECISRRQITGKLYPTASRQNTEAL